MTLDCSKLKYWNEYVESLDGLPDDGVFGLLEYVSNKLEMAREAAASIKAIKQAEEE